MVSYDDVGNMLVQMNVSGSQGDQSELGYGVGMLYSSGNDIVVSKMVVGNLSYKIGVGQYGMMVLVNNSLFCQLFVFVNGSLVVYQGGVIIGLCFGDVFFVIVYVEGVVGVKLFNGNGVIIDSCGYVIMLLMIVYCENIVVIDYKELFDLVDVLES